MTDHEREGAMLRPENAASAPTARVLHARTGPLLISLPFGIFVFVFGAVLCVAARAWFPLVFWLIGGTAVLGGAVAEAVVLRGDRIRLDAECISLCTGPPLIGRWSSVPWSQVSGIEDLGKGVRVHTPMGWYVAKLGRHPVIIADDYLPTILRWWQTYGHPPPPRR